MNRKHSLGLATVLLAAVALGAFGIKYWKSLRDDIPFDAALWREPQGKWDRWRMLADFKRMLEAQRPTRAELIERLDGRMERQPSRAVELDSSPHSLRYHLGNGPPGRSGSGDITLYFGEDGRYSSYDTSHDAL